MEDVLRNEAVPEDLSPNNVVIKIQIFQFV